MRTRDGLDLSPFEAKVYRATLTVAQRHGIEGTDSEIEAAIIGRPDLIAEIRRTLVRHESGWAPR
jgi:hypothetical protein